MKETSKAMRRRYAEADEGGFPWHATFKGEMLDVGAGDDPLPGAWPFTLPDGGGDDLRDFFIARRFDLIHGSQVLEHAKNPGLMLKSWIACLKEHGYIVATVPDFKLYEKETWPSKFNAGHRSIWTLDSDLHARAINAYGRSKCLCILLPEWFNQFLNTQRPVEILLCRLVTTNYDPSVGPEVDQTYDPDKGVECFIEFVLRRRDK